MDELAALTRHQREYRECSLLLFTETWLTALTPDTAAELDGFKLLRADRSKESVSRLQTQHPDALLLISGDFNHASPSSSLPKFTQYVTCHTHLLNLEFESRRRFITSDVLKEQDRAIKILEAYPYFRELDHVLDELQRIIQPTNSQYISEMQNRWKTLYSKGPVLWSDEEGHKAS
ncbi:hypothetical protein L3Q82_019107 [Scortum barcoo]|uniref:Uncharacterized protein n=1 Tax=Scortum barcoo TaxID=214431 RepID=A0ACB8VGA1_9TELE|nr:hypothetical protein L3Q82_019107 [Scortum barcoo]